jgi:cyclohexanone monooxygenase
MQPASPSSAEETLDILIVGAGLSGIGAARHLQVRCPEKSYAIIEARDAIGGTWDLFRYPGIRSDSDMYTLGYAFKPWTDPKSIADGPAILRYVRDTASENGIVDKIRFGRKMLSAAWSSAEACWTVEIEHAAAKTRSTLRTRFLFMCSGYYSYDEAHRPEFENEAQFRGAIVQPQFWPEGLDYANKRVIVIGSGATAATLVPEMAKSAAHVTMVQRSPTYMVARPSEDAFALRLSRHLPARAAYALTRWKNIVENLFLFWLLRTFPGMTKRKMITMAAKQLGEGYDVRTHFTPRYRPWDQRICLVPDGDMFHAIRAGRASVATGAIAGFTAEGLRLESGEELQADIVVLATGLKVQFLGGGKLSIDGKPIETGEAMTYKGMMLGDVPNFAFTFGYTNASWTLKSDLIATYVCRLLRHMERRRKDIAVPRREADVAPQPFLPFTSGYVQRALPIMWKQGSRRPWRTYQNYLKDVLTLRFGRIEDGVMRLGEKGNLP